MNYPSVKAIRRAFPALRRGQPTAIRRVMADTSLQPYARMRDIDMLLGTHGVEFIPEGHNSKSPSIYYCNTGDTYGTTILFVGGRFRIGDWGDIVERGQYD